MFLAARSLNVAFVNATLGRAIGNRNEADASRRSQIPHSIDPVLRISVLKGVHVVAADISCLLTLGYLGLAGTLIKSFSKIVIGSGTLTSLFEERQRVRFHQPSRVERAKRLRKLMDDGKLKVANLPSSLPADLVTEVDNELAGLLMLAKADGGTVVRPGPWFCRFVQRIAHLPHDRAWRRRLRRVHRSPASPTSRRRRSSVPRSW